MWFDGIWFDVHLFLDGVSVLTFDKAGGFTVLVTHISIMILI